MVASCFSLASLFHGYLRRSFVRAGLSPHSLDIDDNTTLHYWGPRTRTSSKPQLLLIHGFGPSGLWQWRQQVVALSTTFDIYVPDLVFFGESTSSCAERTEIFQACCLMRLMERVLGTEKYSVVGTSYGGFVAYRMAERWPERLEKVVIASSGLNMVKGHNEALIKRVDADKVEDLLLPQTALQLRASLSFVFFRPPSLLPTFMLNDFVDKLYSRNRKEKIQLLKGLTLGLDDVPNISPVRQEVLIIWGEHDQVFPLPMALQLKEILGDNSRLEVIKNASHVPQIESPPNFNSIIRNFLCGSSQPASQ